MANGTFRERSRLGYHTEERTNQHMQNYDRFEKQKDRRLKIEVLKQKELAQKNKRNRLEANRVVAAENKLRAWPADVTFGSGAN